VFGYRGWLISFSHEDNAIGGLSLRDDWLPHRHEEGAGGTEERERFGAVAILLQEVYGSTVYPCNGISYNKVYALHRFVAEFNASNPTRTRLSGDLSQSYCLARTLLEGRRLVSDSQLRIRRLR
jgi:hypothetical protein